jgi:hypothetical protein
VRDSSFLGYYAVPIGTYTYLPKFRRIVVPSSSGSSSPFYLNPILSLTFPREAEKTNWNFSLASRSRGRGLNPRPWNMKHGCLLYRDIRFISVTYHSCHS